MHHHHRFNRQNHHRHGAVTMTHTGQGKLGRMDFCNWISVAEAETVECRGPQAAARPHVPPLPVWGEERGAPPHRRQGPPRRVRRAVQQHRLAQRLPQAAGYGLGAARRVGQRGGGAGHRVDGDEVQRPDVGVRGRAGRDGAVAGTGTARQQVVRLWRNTNPQKKTPQRN